MTKTLFELFKDLLAGILFIVFVAGIAFIVTSDVSIKNIFEHNAIGKWQAEKYSNLMIFNDNTAIFASYPCGWSHKSDNFIVLDCKFGSSGNFVMTFETTSSAQHGTLIRGTDVYLYQKVKANF